MGTACSLIAAEAICGVGASAIGISSKIYDFHKGRKKNKKQATYRVLLPPITQNVKYHHDMKPTSQKKSTLSKPDEINKTRKRPFNLEHPYTKPMS